MRKPRGHIRPHGAGYEVAVPVGQDPITKRYRYLYEQAPAYEGAERVRDRLIAEVTSGREPRTKAKFGELLDKRGQLSCGGHHVPPEAHHEVNGHLEYAWAAP